ncbi:MAG TPA: hypothetical protein VNL71_06910 [Chloroflexota bacterium]|nr:hypothetical protein [Chloroflexota bacterium]
MVRRQHPPSRLTFVVDRSLGRTLAERMREIGMDVHWLDDHFAQNAKDEVWLPEVGVSLIMLICQGKRWRDQISYPV